MSRCGMGDLRSCVTVEATPSASAGAQAPPGAAAFLRECKGAAPGAESGSETAKIGGVISLAGRFVDIHDRAEAPCSGRDPSDDGPALIWSDWRWWVLRLIGLCGFWGVASIGFSTASRRSTASDSPYRSSSARLTAIDDDSLLKLNLSLSSLLMARRGSRWFRDGSLLLFVSRPLP
jgi:hypothetical protein